MGECMVSEEGVVQRALEKKTGAALCISEVHVVGRGKWEFNLVFFNKEM